MIFTTFAAAALAAITGVATVRAPGGNQQQVEVNPEYAYEVSVAEIANPKAFLENLGSVVQDLDSFNPREGLSQNQNRNKKAAKSIFSTFRDGLLSSGIEAPETITYFNMYHVEERTGPRPRVKFKVDVYDYSIITIADGDENVATFIDAPKGLLMQNGAPNHEFDDFYIITSGAVKAASQEVFRIVWEKVAELGIDEVNHAKEYVNHIIPDPDDNTLPPPIDWRDWISETFGAGQIGIADLMIHLMASGSLLEKINAMSGKYSALENYEYSILAGTHLSMALEQADYNIGQYALNTSVVGSAMQTVLTTGYDNVLANNGLYIVQ